MAQVPATSYTTVAPGGVTTFSIPFDFLSRADVFVTVDGVTTAFTWINDGMINISPAPAAGKVVTRYRNTPAESTLHVFEGGVPFTPRFIDENNNQLLYVVQESVNTSSSALGLATTAQANSTVAVATANGAVATANGAVVTANTAEANSNTAIATADATVIVANAASGNAAAAVATADAAVAVANAAQSTADDALSQIEDAVSGSVVSFNGRTGAVVPAANDYALQDIYGGGFVIDFTGDTNTLTIPGNYNVTGTSLNKPGTGGYFIQVLGRITPVRLQLAYPNADAILAAGGVTHYWRVTDATGAVWGQWVPVVNGVKQTSPIDIAAGAITTVGSFGLGLVGNAEIITDLNVTAGSPSGMYRAQVSTTGDKPAGSAPNGQVLVERFSTTIVKQTWTDVVGGSGITPRTWTRTSYAVGTWGPWFETAIAFQLATNFNAIPSSGFYQLGNVTGAPPVSTTLGWSVWQFGGFGPGRSGTQFAVTFDGTSVWFRSCANGTFLPWVKVADGTDSGWITPTLLNSFTQDGTNPLQYRKVGNRVFLRGTIRRASPYSIGVTIGTIPVGYRPLIPTSVGPQVWMDGADFSLTLVTPAIHPDGTLNAGFAHVLSGTMTGAGSLSINTSWTVD